MSVTITRNRIRVAVDNILNRTIELVDTLTSAAVRFWQCEDVQVEVAIYSSGTIAADISNFTSITLELKDPANLLSSPLLTATALKTGSVTPQVDLDQSVTSGEWLAGTAQHAVFVLSNTQTNIELQGAKSRELWLFLWGTTSDSSPYRVPLGRGPVTLMDSGYGDIGAITVTPTGARMHNNILQVRNPDDGKYYDVAVRTVDGGNKVVEAEGAGDT